MPNITLTVSGRTASTDIAEIINGNNDYTVTVSADREWTAYTNPRILLTRYLADGTTPTEEIALMEGGAQLPAFSDTCAIGLALTATNGADPVTSSSTTLLCQECITDGDTAEYLPQFDVYNAMLEYANAKLSGSATESELAAQYQAIEEYWASLPSDDPYPASYRAAIAAPWRYTKLTGSITYIDGNEIELTSANIMADSVSIAFDCTADGGALPGGVPAFELKMTLRGIPDTAALYGAEISLSFYIMLPGGWYEVPLGVFTVRDVADDTEQGTPLTAYDDMYSLGNIPIEQLGIEEGRAYTPQEIITMCADTLGIAYSDDVSGWINGYRAFVLSDMDSNVKTARDLLMYAVQIVCGFSYVDRHRRLRVIPITTHDAHVKIEPTQRMSIAVTKKEYRLFCLTTTIEYPNEDGNRMVEERRHYTMWPDGVTMQLAENPLFTTLDVEQRLRAGSIRQMLSNLANQLDPVVFHPVTAEIFGDPSIEPSEWRDFTRDGSTYRAPIMIHEWKYGNTASISTSGQDAIAGVVQDQAEKAAIAKRINAAEQSDNIVRELFAAIIKSSGHAAMAIKTHEWLAHYTHGELSGEEDEIT